MLVAPKYATRINPRVIRELSEEAPPWGPAGYVTYARTYSRTRTDLGRNEHWHETLERGLNGILDIGGVFTNEQIEKLAYYWYNLKGTPAGRPLWQLGTETVKKLGGDSLQNCWHCSIDEPVEPFCFAFNELMLGGGVGFNVLPENVYALPVVKYAPDIIRIDSFDCDYIVTDNREGWVELLRRALTAFFYNGKSFTYCTQGIRSKGTPINGFGGTASGPEGLVRGLKLICKILANARGRKLRPVECMDIMNIIAMIVVAGNVRRSAEIALGDVFDEEFLRAKDWSRFTVPEWRQQSNNTVRCNDTVILPEHFWDGYYGNGEPYGLYNEELSKHYGRLADPRDYRPDFDIQGPNPCIPADTWIQTDQGPRRVSELIDVPFNALVDGFSYPSTEKGFFASGVKMTYKVTTDRGFAFKCTGNHQIETPDRDWLELDELEVGDEIKLHKHLGASWKGDGSEERGWLLGSLVGDGVFIPDAAQLSFWGVTKFTMHEYAVELLERNFPSGPTLGESEGDPDSDRINVRSKELLLRAQRHGIGPDKKIGDAIERTSSAFHIGFLRGWFDADGSIQGDRLKGRSIRLWSVIPENLQAAQRMLARLGIMSTIYYDRVSEGDRWLSTNDGTGQYKLYHCQAGHELVISKDNMARFASLIGFIDPVKSTALAESLKGKRELYRDKFTAKIASIEPVGLEPVYDCTIKYAHQFDGNGVHLHNCAEILLENYEACNLMEIFLPNIASPSEFGEVAGLLFRAAKAIGSLDYIHARTTEVVRKNQRIGIGVTGYLGSKFIDNAEVFDAVYAYLEEVDVEVSQQMGLRKSIKMTCVKPSGTLSLLAGVSPGVHPAFAHYYIRRIQFAATNPLLSLLRATGHDMEPKLNIDGSRNYDTIVVDFPHAMPAGTICAENLSAVEQLENQAFLQRHWADNAVSMTCYYRLEELDEMRAWMRENYATDVKTMSCLLHQGHGFQQAPYEEITREQYLELSAKTQPLTSALIESEFVDIGDDGCVGGICPVR